MAITYFPFNSVIINNVPDRAANAETLALYLKTFFTNGVVLDKSSAMQVKAKSGLTVTIQPGTAFLDGRILHSSAIEEFTLDQAGSVLNRIDRVIFRLDYANRLIKFMVLKGEEGSEPAAPALTRSADVYDMCLAEVYVRANAAELTQANITDTRANTAMCGIAGAAITQLDTSTMYEQYAAQFEEAYADMETWTAEKKTIIENMIAALQEQNFEKAATYSKATMLSSGWSGKTYSFESAYPFDECDIFIQPDGDNATDAQMDAYISAQLAGSSVSNAVKAFGYVPEIDIPIIIRRVAK